MQQIHHYGWWLFLTEEIEDAVLSCKHDLLERYNKSDVDITFDPEHAVVEGHLQTPVLMECIKRLNLRNTRARNMVFLTSENAKLYREWCGQFSEF